MTFWYFKDIIFIEDMRKERVVYNLYHTIKSMKVIKKHKAKILLILLILICTFSSTVFAENTTENIVTTAENETITAENETVADENIIVTGNGSEEEQVTTINDGDLYLFDDTVSIEEKVNGNVFIFAGTVNINTQIDGNVFIIADDVNILSKSYIYGTAFIGGTDVTISGYINDLYSISKEIRFGTNATILRDAHIMSQEATLNGEFRKNLYLCSQDISINKASTEIEGNLEYTSKNDVIPEDVVSGEIEFSKLKNGTSSVLRYLEDAVYEIITAVIVILIIIFATPKFADKEEELIKTKTLKTIGYGALALVLIPVICVALMFTIIGIIPALIILFIYAFIQFIASYLVAVPIAKILCKKINNNNKLVNILLSIVVAIVIWLLELIPFVGGIISIFVSIMALGLITYSIIDKISRNRKSAKSKEENVKQVENK